MVAQTAYNTVFRALHAVKNGFNHERQNLDAARDYETRMLFFNQFSSNLELLKTQIQLTNSALDSRTLPHLTDVVVACDGLLDNFKYLLLSFDPRNKDIKKHFFVSPPTDLFSRAVAAIKSLSENECLFAEKSDVLLSRLNKNEFLSAYDRLLSSRSDLFPVVEKEIMDDGSLVFCFSPKEINIIGSSIPHGKQMYTFKGA